MGKGKKQTVGYWYLMGLHMGICKGPIDMLISIMGGERVAWSGIVTSNQRIRIDAGNLWGGEKKEGGISGDLDVMMGEANQQPNDYLSGAQGGQFNPAYRGLFGTVFRKGKVGAITPYLKPWAYRVRRIKKGWESGSCWYPEKAEIDVGAQPDLQPQGRERIHFKFLGAELEINYPPVELPPRILCANPAHVIYEILTDTEDGMSHPAGNLNEASFRAAADLFHSEGLGLWVKWVRSDEIQEILQQVLDHANALLVQDPEDLTFRIVPMRGGYDMASLVHFGPRRGGYDVDCVLEDLERVTPEETVNEVTVQWNDSSDNRERSVTVHNLAAIQAAKGVVNQTKAYACCPTEAIAARLAQRDLDVYSSMLARVRIRANRRAYKVVPGQVIKLTWPAEGIANMPVRVLRVTDNAAEQGDIVIEGTEDVFQFGTTTYIKPQQPGWVDPNGSPQPAAFVEAFEVPFRDLVQQFGMDAAKQLDPLAGFAATAASQAPGFSINFTAYNRIGAEDWKDVATGDFTPTCTLSAGVTMTQTVLPIANLIGDWGTLQIGTVAFLGAHPQAEAIRIDSMNPERTQITVARGCLDTLPPLAGWPAGTRLWCYDNDSVLDPTQYVVGEQVTSKAVTNSGTGQIALENAPQDAVTMNQRAARPYPPAALSIAGQAAPAAVSGSFTVTWKHRDRFLQADQAIGQAEAGAGPDPLTRYGMRFRDASGVELTSRTDVAGDTATVVLNTTGAVTMQLWALNDDGNSWHQHQRTFTYTPPAGVVESAITAPIWSRPQNIIDAGEVTPNG